MTEPRFLDKLLERAERVDRNQLEDYIKSLAGDIAFISDAVDASESGIVFLDESLRIKTINRSAESLLGVARSNVLGKNILQCSIDVVLGLLFEKSLALPSASRVQEVEVKFPREQLLRVAISPFEENDKKINQGWTITLFDITEYKKESNKKFQKEKVKAIGTMASILAHELGNPLNSLSIHLQLIDRAVKTLPKAGKAKFSKYIKITKDEIKRLDDIVTRFLQAARPFKPRLFEGDVCGILDRTLELMMPELKKNKIIIEKSFGGDIPKIYIDHIQIRQVFINLVKNALESMKKGGKLKIKLSREDKWVKISFADSGKGIPEEDLEKIFEPYYSTKDGGSGLGLAIVHRIVKDHGGKIEVDSFYGKGTTVSIYLPKEIMGARLLTENK